MEHRTNHPSVAPRRAPPPDDGTAFRERLHFESIRDIAEQFARPYAEVSTAYRALFLALSAQAGVTDYLPLFVARKIRERYRAPAN